MIVFFLILSVFLSIVSILYSRYCCDRVITRLSLIESIPNLYDTDWWQDEEYH